MDIKNGFKKLSEFGLSKVTIATMFGTNPKMVERVLTEPKKTYSVMKDVTEEAKVMRAGIEEEAV